MKRKGAGIDQRCGIASSSGATLPIFVSDRKVATVATWLYTLAHYVCARRSRWHITTKARPIFIGSLIFKRTRRLDLGNSTMIPLTLCHTLKLAVFFAWVLTLYCFQSLRRPWSNRPYGCSLDNPSTDSGFAAGRPVRPLRLGPDICRPFTRLRTKNPRAIFILSHKIFMPEFE